MIDKDGFRTNVGIILVNQANKVFWGQRIRQTSWQFPQGGVNKGESAIAALYRELYEEVGLRPKDVYIMGATTKWLKYRLPSHLIRQVEPLCIGQKQKWFLLKLVSDDSKICLDATGDPEFSDWRWINYWSPLKHVIAFKQTVYRKALEQLYPLVKQAKRRSKGKKRKR